MPGWSMCVGKSRSDDQCRVNVCTTTNGIAYGDLEGFPMGLLDLTRHGR